MLSIWGSQRVPSWVLSPRPTVQINFVAPQGAYMSNGSLVPVGQVLTSGSASTARYAQWADGHYSVFGANALRLTDLGLIAEQTTTNTAVNSNDLSQVSWVKVNVTSALSQVGPDLVANSASLLTATADNGTVLQVPTVVGTARAYSICLKVVGTVAGVIQITIDNGVTWTPLDATNCFNAQRQGTAPNTTQFVRAVLVGVITLGVGLRFTKSGDSAAVWCAQVEGAVTNPSYTSPVPNLASTGTQNRTNDNYALTGTALTAALAGGFPVSLWGRGRVSNANQTIGYGTVSDGTLANEAGLRLDNTSHGLLFTTVSSVSIATASSVNTATNGSMAASAARIANADYSVSLNGSAVGTAATVGALPSGLNKVSVGCRGTGSAPWNEFLTGFAIWSGTGLTNTQLQTIST